MPGSLAGRVACLTAQSRAVTCHPDTLPGAQQAGQRLPGGMGAWDAGATSRGGRRSQSHRPRKLIQPFHPRAPQQTAAVVSTQGPDCTGSSPQGWQNPAQDRLAVLSPRNRKRVPPQREATAGGPTCRPPRSHCPHAGPCEREPEGQGRNRMRGEGATGHGAQVPPGAGGGQEGTPRPPRGPEDAVLQTPRLWSLTSDLERTQVLPQPLIWGARPPGEAGEEVGTVLFAPPPPRKGGRGQERPPPEPGCVTRGDGGSGKGSAMRSGCVPIVNVDFTLQKNPG